MTVEVIGNIPIPRMRPATWPLEMVLTVRNGLVNGTIDFVLITKDQITALATECKVVRAADKIDGQRWEKVKKMVVDSDNNESSNSGEDDNNNNSDSDKETVVQLTLMTPGVGSMLSPVEGRGRCVVSQPPPQQHAAVPSARHLTPTTYFTVPISNTTLNAALTPISNTVLAPATIINTMLDTMLVPAPVSNAAPRLSPGLIPNPAPAPMPISNPIPNPAPVVNPTPVLTPTANIAFIDNFSMLGLGATDSGYDLLFPHMPPLPPTYGDNRGWDMGMGTGTGSYGLTSAEKRECEEDREGDNQPAQKRHRKENTATMRGQRATHSSREQVARGVRAA
ncbi:hypothetical protein B0H14DRAFT_3494711 [Mycena olivaceomarginata]|nr:hypothetical protein B0H14DRAFT_3494711 [Mycena olivaceomarginata]